MQWRVLYDSAHFVDIRKTVEPFQIDTGPQRQHMANDCMIDYVAAQADGRAIRAILQYLTGDDLLAIGCVSRALHTASEDERLWRTVCEDEGECSDTSCAN